MSIPGFLEMTKDSFRIISQLSVGGSSGVYLAEPLDEDLKQRASSGYIVVKSLKPDTSSSGKSLNVTNVQLITPFLQEVSMMAYFRTSPYFASIAGYTREPNMILQRFYQYGTLFDFLHRSRKMEVEVHRPPYNKNLVHKLASDVAKALLCMHSSGLVHHDIKTPNLLLDYNNGVWSVVLTDFGVAKVADAYTLLVKAFRPVKPQGATIIYASPELFTRSRAPFPSTTTTKEMGYDVKEGAQLRAYDTYAFGIVLFELITRCIPWRKLKPHEVQQQLQERQTYPDGPQPPMSQ